MILPWFSPGTMLSKNTRSVNRVTNSRDEYLTRRQHYWSIHAKGENVEDVLKEAEDTGVIPAVRPGDNERTKAAEDGATKPENGDVWMTIDEQASESAPEVYFHSNDLSLVKGLADDI
jgi:hypothetical protein